MWFIVLGIVVLAVYLLWKNGGVEAQKQSEITRRQPEMPGVRPPNFRHLDEPQFALISSCNACKHMGYSENEFYCKKYDIVVRGAGVALEHTCDAQEYQELPF